MWSTTLEDGTDISEQLSQPLISANSLVWTPPAR